MEAFVKKLVFVAALLAAPLAARADGGLRLGVEANVATHSDSGGTSWLGDNWPLAGNVMLSYWTPGSIVSFDLEFAEQFYLNAPAGASSRIGTVIRPGVRISPPLFPIYIRGALPINVETATGERELLDARVGVGLNIPLVLFKIYLEADADFPLTSKTRAGGGSNISAFNYQSFYLGGGLDFRF
jgi:hypothetical protein